MNIANLSTQTALQLNGASSLITTASFGLSNIPKGQYSLQVLWDNGSGDSQLNAPGNLYSESSIIEVKQDFIESIVLDKIVPPRELKSHPLVQKVRLQSPLLSKFWGRPTSLMQLFYCHQVIWKTSNKRTLFVIMWRVMEDVSHA